MSLDEDDRYTEKNPRALAGRARQAFLEYSPIRRAEGTPPPIYRRVRMDRCSTCLPSICGATAGRTRRIGRAYRAPPPSTPARRRSGGSKRALRSSRATWKVIASDLPIGLVVRDDAAFEAIANADSGPPLGRELEIAELLRFIAGDGSATSSGSRAMCTMRRPITTIRSAPVSRRSIRSGSSSCGVQPRMRLLQLNRSSCCLSSSRRGPVTSARTGPPVRTTVRPAGGRTVRSTGTSALAGSSLAARNQRKTDRPAEVSLSGRSAVSARAEPHVRCRARRGGVRPARGWPASSSRARR